MKFIEAHKKAEKEERTEKITPEYVTFEKEKAFVVGQFIGYAEVASSQGDGFYNQYLFNTDIGLVKFAVGSATDKEIIPLMRIGEVYHVEFHGKEKLDAKRSVNKFLVNHIPLTPEERADMDLIDIPPPPHKTRVGGVEDEAF